MALSKSLQNTGYAGAVINVEDYGAVGDFNYTTLTGTDNHQAFTDALAAAQLSTGGKKVFVPAGHYLIGTDAGTLLIPEGVELCGEGGTQTREVDVESQGTTLLIRGTVNELFEYERATFVHNLRFDYPDQDEDPATPTTYPACFTNGSTSGSRSFFQNLIFDRTFWAFDSSGGTFWNNVHGCVYRRFIRIGDSDALCHISDCSLSAVWHMGTYTNTLVYQQENLNAFEVVGGADGLSIDNFSTFVANSLIALTGGDKLNFFKASNVLCDGVPNVLNADGTVEMLSMQFSNCKFGTLNSYGSTYGNEVFNIDSTSSATYANRSIMFDNCEFRNANRSFFTIDGGGIDVLKFTGCSFFNWNIQDVNIVTYGAIYANYSTLRLTLSGCSFNNKPQEDLTVDSGGVVIADAEALNMNGCDFKDLTNGVRYAASSTITDATYVGNSGNTLTDGILKPGTETITNEVDSGNNWPVV